MTSYFYSQYIQPQLIRLPASYHDDYLLYAKMFPVGHELLKKSRVDAFCKETGAERGQAVHALMQAYLSYNKKGDTSVDVDEEVSNLIDRARELYEEDISMRFSGDDSGFSKEELWQHKSNPPLDVIPTVVLQHPAGRLTRMNPYVPLELRRSLMDVGLHYEAKSCPVVDTYKCNCMSEIV
jgi:hypothetical protein